MSNKWQFNFLNGRRFTVGHWFTGAQSLAHEGFFAAPPQSGTYTFNSSAEFRGFVGSAGLNFNPLERAFTYASTAEFAGFAGSAGITRSSNFQFTFTSTAEFAGFVGSAGPTFNPLEVAYTYASTAEFAGFTGSAFTQYVAGFVETFSVFTWTSTAEFAGFAGSAGLDFNPFERAYTATTSPEFAGFTGSAAPSQAPNFARTATTSPEFAGFTGSAATAVTGPPFVYTATTSPEFAGFRGDAATNYIPFIDPSSLPPEQRRSGGGLLVRGKRRGIIDIISPLPPIDLPPPRVYNAVVGMDGGFSPAAGAADVTFRRQPLNHAALAMAGVFN